MVRSKSEVIIANMLSEREIPFKYEVPLYASDGTFYLPDFTITWRGEQWYWEHLGLLESERYRTHWEQKHAWYEKFFPDRLVTTVESGNLSQDANQIIEQFFS
jgi:exodeoxyribonuclease V alpha subunit